MNTDDFIIGLPLKEGSFEVRPYQVEVAKRVLSERGSLVVLATALGKTYVALLVYAALLRGNPKARCLFLAPTKPLVAQHARKLKECLSLEGEVAVLTGEQEPEQRRRVYESAQVIAATPQAVANDIREGRADLSVYSLIVFDEAHRAVGDYAYVPVAAEAQKAGVIILGLTASPSSQREKVDEVCRNLGVRGVVYKSERDDDVAQYANPVEMEHVFVKLPPEMDGLRTRLRELYGESVLKLQPWGLRSKEPNRRELLMLKDRLVRGMPRTARALSEVARAINVAHATDLLESQGVGALVDYLERLREREVKSKAVLGLLADRRVAELRKEAEALLSSGLDHPKVGSLRALVQDTVAEGKSVIVFVHFRSSAERVCAGLNGLPGVKARLLVGRAGESGMKQAEQVATVESFSGREFNTLVCTQVGEEGLSISSVDLVVFYEAVPSEIRLIQRRGRTGRVRAGRAVVLVTKGTKDEAFLWVSRGKERRMRGVLEGADRSLRSEAGGQSRVSEFV